MSGHTRIHRMPFGAEPCDHGEFGFRLWAPSARSVELCLIKGGLETIHSMAGTGAGWHECQVRADSGDRYAFRMDGGLRVPDPASRFQPDDVHAPSMIIDPAKWEWTDMSWTGRPWEETVLYELHVGTFTSEGTFAGVEQRLDHLVDLGITGLELMPVSDFPGKRNWGYDGVFPFAPDSRYGRPEDLKRLVQSAHQRGLMVFLDVVYNHFGPEGNYLYAYCPEFFNKNRHTPWGAAINFDNDATGTVREFFIQNALFWLVEYHMDGLRFDAVHAIHDDSSQHILEEIAVRVHAGPGLNRHVHLVLENDANEARFLARKPGGRPKYYVAQWNDDIHHALHVLGTGETSGYYTDYAGDPVGHLGRCLTEGYAYQGDPSPYRDGAIRGERSSHLAPAAFVSFIQNHDQVGNRAFGERFSSLAPTEAFRALTAVMLLAPSPPLLFMGQEWSASHPFLFFCDFGDDLRKTVTEGRRKEFARFPEFSDPKARETIPDPSGESTFRSSVLDWTELDRNPHREWFRFHRDLLLIRRKEIAPRLSGMQGGAGSRRLFPGRLLRVTWKLGDASMLHLVANLGPVAGPSIERPEGRLIYGSEVTGFNIDSGPWSVHFFIQASPGRTDMR